MAQPRPSMTLVLDIDERVDSEELRLEIDRCYAHVGATVVRTHTAEGEDAHHTMGLLVKLGTRHYLCSEDEGADELWYSVMEQWLHNQFYKVSNNMAIFNRRQRETKAAELHFDWLEVDLQNGALKALLHLDSNCMVEPSCSTLITQLRTAYNRGLLGEGAARVVMPDPAAYEAQRAVGLAAKQEREVKARVQQEEAAAAAQAKRAAEEAAAAESFLGASAPLSDTPELQDSADQGVNDDAFFLAEPDFAISYHPWSIEYNDGSTRAFDASAQALFQEGAA